VGRCRLANLLQKAIAHQRGKQTGVKLHVPPAVDVKEVRRRTG